MALTKTQDASVSQEDKTNYFSTSATTTVSRLIRENQNRKELMITNTSAAILYISFSRLPSSTDYAIAIPPNGIFITSNVERVNGVWASAGGGQANVVEVLV